MKIFITGVAGFLGSHLADLMLSEGHAVVFDREAPFELRIQDPNSGP